MVLKKTNNKMKITRKCMKFMVNKNLTNLKTENQESQETQNLSMKFFEKIITSLKLY